MNTDKHRLTEQILGAVFEVSNTLGAGFFPGFYKDLRAGDYFADILVENSVVVELKCVEHLPSA